MPGRNGIYHPPPRRRCRPPKLTARSRERRGDSGARPSCSSLQSTPPWRKKRKSQSPTCHLRQGQFRRRSHHPVCVRVLTPKPSLWGIPHFGRQISGRDGRWRLKTSSDGVELAEEVVATGPRYKFISGPTVIRATPRARQGWSTFAHVCARATDADVGQQLHHPKVRETCRLRLRRTHPFHPHPGQAWS